MKDIRFFMALTFVLLGMLSFYSSFCQDSGTSFFSVEGEVLRSLNLSVNDLHKLKSTELKAKDKDGTEHNFKGVSLSEVLDSAGVTLGNQLRGANLAKYVLVQATDGYEVVFSLPEIDPEFSNEQILLAYQVDGRALQPHDGPFRLVVPSDKKHARWIRQIKTIKVLFSKS